MMWLRNIFIIKSHQRCYCETEKSEHFTSTGDLTNHNKVQHMQENFEKTQTNLEFSYPKPLPIWHFPDT